MSTTDSVMGSQPVDATIASATSTTFVADTSITLNFEGANFGGGVVRATAGTLSGWGAGPTGVATACSAANGAAGYSMLQCESGCGASLIWSAPTTGEPLPCVVTLSVIGNGNSNAGGAVQRTLSRQEITLAGPVGMCVVATSAPTSAPTKAPTAVGQTYVPTTAPTRAPSSKAPTVVGQTYVPSTAPSQAPSLAPSQTPTAVPTQEPTQGPSAAPSTSAPTASPLTSVPTASRTGRPTSAPTSAYVPDSAAKQAAEGAAERKKQSTLAIVLVLVGIAVLIFAAAIVVVVIAIVATRKHNEASAKFEDHMHELTARSTPLPPVRISLNEVGGAVQSGTAVETMNPYAAAAERRRSMLGPPPGKAATLKASAMEAAAAAAAASAAVVAGRAATGCDAAAGANPFLAAPESVDGAKQRRPSRHVVKVRRVSKHYHHHRTHVGESASSSDSSGSESIDEEYTASESDDSPKALPTVPAKTARKASVGSVEYKPPVPSKVGRRASTIGMPSAAVAALKKPAPRAPASQEL